MDLLQKAKAMIKTNEEKRTPSFSPTEEKDSSPFGQTKSPVSAENPEETAVNND